MMEERELRSIELDLANEDEEIRRLAVERLAALSAEEAMPKLLACLGDPGWRVRKTAVERLAGAPSDWHVDDALVAALADGDNPGRRNSAVEALVRRGESAVDPLLAATRDPDVDVRKQAVDTLAGIGTHRALDRLLEMLEDPDLNVCAAAADALGVIGDDAVGPELLRASTREAHDPLVAFSALQALARLEVVVPADDLAPLLDSNLLRPAAYAVLGQADEGDESALEALLKGVLSDSRSSREAAISALLRLLARRDGAAAEALAERVRTTFLDAPIDELLGRVATADLSTRLVLVQFLGVLRREEATLPVLLAGADEALSEVVLAALVQLGEQAERGFDSAWSELPAEARRLACRALSLTQGPVGEARLLGALDDPDATLRAAAAEALGARGCGAALPALVNRLEAVAVQDGDPDGDDERAALTAALVQLTEADATESGALHDQAVGLLGQRLDGAPEPVRLALATVLGRIGRAQDESLVAWLLKDPSSGVRRAAVQALARLGHGEDSEPLRLALADEAPEVRTAAARALAASHSPSALDDLEHLADDEDPRVRAAAMRAVGHRALDASEADAERARARLARAVSDDGMVALAAIEALVQVGGDASLRAARSILAREEPELVQAGVSCIARHGDRDTVEELVPLVGHPSWVVRAEVIGMLADRNVVGAVPAILRRLETEQDEFVRDAILRALGRLEG
jgi:HEAT repeat protein